MAKIFSKSKEDEMNNNVRKIQLEWRKKNSEKNESLTFFVGFLFHILWQQQRWNNTERVKNVNDLIIASQKQNSNS